MSRVLFFIALLVSSVSAFVAPAGQAVSSLAFTAPKMMEAVDMGAANDFLATQSANLIATSSNDFGGAFIPVAGIALLAAFILYLSPPLADE